MDRDADGPGVERRFLFRKIGLLDIAVDNLRSDLSDLTGAGAERCQQ